MITVKEAEEWWWSISSGIEKESFLKEGKNLGLIEKSQMEWAEEYVEEAKKTHNVWYALKAIEIYRKEIDLLRNPIKEVD